MNKYQLSRQQRDNISVDDLKMLILRIFQDVANQVNRVNRISSTLECITGIAVSRGGIEASFQRKFDEAVNELQNGSFIIQDPSQPHLPDFQRLTSKGSQVDTTAPVLGITSVAEFIRKVEADAGTLDEVAKTYLMESYATAELNLWLSSIFMLGAASERLIYVLTKHIDHLLADPAASTALSKIDGVRQRKEWIVSHLPTLKKKFPSHREAFSDVEDKFDSLYNTYRYQRNEAGHPRDTPFRPDTQQAKAMLFSFGLYAQAVNVILAIP